MLTWLAPILTAVAGALLAHFLSTVRFRIGLRAELLKEASGYLSRNFIDVVAREQPIASRMAYDASVVPGEDLAARIRVLFYPRVVASFDAARRLIVPNTLTDPPNTHRTKAYRLAMYNALAAMERAFTIRGMLVGWLLRLSPATDGLVI